MRADLVVFADVILTSEVIAGDRPAERGWVAISDGALVDVETGSLTASRGQQSF